MPATERSEALVSLLRGTIAGLVQRDRPDLSARQLAIFMTCYLNPPPQSVRGLSEHLKVSRPAITRALDRLTQFDLIRRKSDPADRRSVLVQRTSAGNAYLRELRSILNIAAEAPVAAPKPARRQRGGLTATL